ncbi:hypothetical protein [Hymenobacter sp. AT01-02]|uniref:hypothetical protein n=1 Tax=Hymenobacter sp. AT01-02 TaxID=1571877 RepID=UPI00128FCBDC|nr:hypothetical protein [Hymenobacter sp. AT01-02]
MEGLHKPVSPQGMNGQTDDLSAFTDPNGTISPQYPSLTDRSATALSTVDPLSPEGLQADADTDGSFVTGLKSFLNQLDPRKIAGNVVDYAGDLADWSMYSFVRPGKATDQLGKELRDKADANALKLNRKANASILDEPTNPLAWSKLLGGGAGSIVQVGAAAALGGPGAGIAAGSALGISATKDAAREAGIGDQEAALTATVLAPIQGVLEEVGLGFITKNPAALKLVQSAIIKRALAYGEGKLAKNALVKAASELMPEVVKKYATRAATGAAGEAVTEGAQSLVEGEAQIVADAARSPDAPGKYGTTQLDVARKAGESMAAAVVLGGAAGGFNAAPQQVNSTVGQLAETSPSVNPLAAVAAPTLQARAIQNEPAIKAHPVAKLKTGATLLADFAQDGTAIRAYDEQGAEYSLEDPAVRQRVEQAAPIAETTTNQATPAASNALTDTETQESAYSAPISSRPSSSALDNMLPSDSEAPSTAETVDTPSQLFSVSLPNNPIATLEAIDNPFGEADSPVPVNSPYFSAEESAAIQKMVNALVKQGVVKTQRVIAGMRESGLTEEDATDAQLFPVVRQALKDAGVFRAKQKAPTGTLIGDVTRERQSIQRLAAAPATPVALMERVRDASLDTYQPRSLAEAEKEVEHYVQRVSLDEAVSLAISPATTLHSDVRTALRVKVLNNLSRQSDAALWMDDQAEAERLLDQSYAVAEALAKRGTEAGQEINAYKLLARHSPAAVVVAAQKEVRQQRDKKTADVAAQSKQVATRARAVQREVVDATLESEAIQKLKAQLEEKTSELGRLKSQLAEANKKLSAGQLSGKIAQVRQKRANLWANLKKLNKQVGIIDPAQERAELHVAIFSTYLDEGVLQLKKLVLRFREEGKQLGVDVNDPNLEQQAQQAIDARIGENVRAGIRDLGATLDEIVRRHVREQEETGRTLAEKLVAEAGLTDVEAAAYVKAVEAEFARQVAARRESVLDRLHSKLGAVLPKRTVKTALEQLLGTLNLAPIADQRVTDILQAQLDLPQLTPQDVQHLRKLAEAVQTAPTGFQKDDAVSKLLAAQQKIKGVNLLDIGNAMWYANVLSNPKTHLINLVANLLQTGAELGVSTIYNAGQGRLATAPTKGLVRGLQRGVLEARSVLATGREVSRDGSKYEIPGLLETIAFTGGKLNPASYLKYVTRMLRAGDVLFSSGLKEMRAYELAVRDAVEQRGDGEPTTQTWERVYETLYYTEARLQAAEAQARTEGLTGLDFKRRVFELVEESRPDQARQQARNYAVRAVFNGDVKGALGVVATGIQMITEHFTFQTRYGDFKPGKYVVPFTRVITSVANAYLDYTPVGALRAAKGSTLFGGKAEWATQEQYTTEQRHKLLIKSTIGAATLIAAYALSHEEDEDGKVTMEISGAGTGNFNKDAQLKLTGWQPYSVKWKAQTPG